jgi:hypothetical protein
VVVELVVVVLEVEDVVELVVELVVTVEVVVELVLVVVLVVVVVVVELVDVVEDVVDDVVLVVVDVVVDVVVVEVVVELVLVVVDVLVVLVVVGPAPARGARASQAAAKTTRGAASGRMRGSFDPLRGGSVSRVHAQEVRNSRPRGVGPRSCGGSPRAGVRGSACPPSASPDRPGELVP